MARVTWTEPALADLQAIVAFVARDSVRYAERLAERLVATPRRLESFPLSGRIVPEFDRDDLRELIYGSYRILYWIRGDECSVVTVIHGSRDLPRHFSPADWEVD